MIRGNSTVPANRCWTAAGTHSGARHGNRSWPKSRMSIRTSNKYCEAISYGLGHGRRRGFLPNIQNSLRSQHAAAHSQACFQFTSSRRGREPSRRNNTDRTSRTSLFDGHPRNVFRSDVMNGPLVIEPGSNPERRCRLERRERSALSALFPAPASDFGCLPESLNHLPVYLERSRKQSDCAFTWNSISPIPHGRFHDDLTVSCHRQTHSPAHFKNHGLGLEPKLTPLPSASCHWMIRELLKTAVAHGSTQNPDAAATFCIACESAELHDRDALRQFGTLRETQNNRCTSERSFLTSPVIELFHRPMPGFFKPNIDPHKPRPNLTSDQPQPNPKRFIRRRIVERDRCHERRISRAPISQITDCIESLHCRFLAKKLSVDVDRLTTQLPAVAPASERSATVPQAFASASPATRNR